MRRNKMQRSLSSARAAELNERVKQCSSESASIAENKVTNDYVHR